MYGESQPILFADFFVAGVHPHLLAANESMSSRVSVSNDQIVGISKGASIPFMARKSVDKGLAPSVSDENSNLEVSAVLHYTGTSLGHGLSMRREMTLPHESHAIRCLHRSWVTGALLRNVNSRQLKLRHTSTTILSHCRLHLRSPFRQTTFASLIHWERHCIERMWVAGLDVFSFID